MGVLMIVKWVFMLCRQFSNIWKLLFGFMLELLKPDSKSTDVSRNLFSDFRSFQITGSTSAGIMGPLKPKKQWDLTSWRMKTIVLDRDQIRLRKLPQLSEGDFSWLVLPRCGKRKISKASDITHETYLIMGIQRCTENLLHGQVLRFLVFTDIEETIAN